MVADQSGGVTAANTYNFTPFGEGIGNDPGSQNKQGYTGHIEDETGLTYMQARYYDPVIGRFLSADPIGYADQLNLYAYVGSDPINQSDPTGMCPECNWDDGFRRTSGQMLTESPVGQIFNEGMKRTKAGVEKVVDRSSATVTGGASAITGVEVSGTVDAQTAEDGTYERAVTVGETNQVEAQVAATVDFRVAGDKDVGKVTASFSLKVVFVGIEFNKGTNGSNLSVHVGPQFGFKLKGLPQVEVKGGVSVKERVPLP